VVAEDSEHHVVEGSDQTFTTLAPLRVDTLSVGGVSAEGATLEARVDPLGSAGEYRFEYAAAGEAENVTGTFPIVAGKEDVTVSAHVQGLRADTAYSYRVVASNGLGEAPAPAPRRFKTQPAGAPFALLDGRGWEQVSPPDKGAANLSLTGGAGGLRAAPSGGAIVYLSRGGSEAQPQGEPLVSDNVSRHGVGGWSTRDISPPNAQRYSFGGIGFLQYYLFSEDLQRSVINPSPFTPLSQWTSEPAEYLRDEAKCPQGVVSVAQVQASECFLPLLTDEGPFADVAPGVQFGGEYRVVVHEATPDLSHIVLSAGNAELLGGAGIGGLYEWSAGKLVLLSLTPQDTACGAGAIGAPAEEGSWGEMPRNALSPDGERAVWSTEASAPGCGGHLFLRFNAMQSQSAIGAGECTESEKACTLQLDEVQQGGSGAGGPGAYYQDASVGDEHIFFTDSQRLTADSTGVSSSSTGAKPDLYEYSFDPATGGGGVVDMTVPVNAGEAAGVVGVAGASENGSVVYVIATGLLSAEANAREEHAIPGEHNLYKLERTQGAWRATFIATLSTSDQPDWGVGGGSVENPGERVIERAAHQTTRVSPDGNWLAFMSDRSLTGYDNEDVTSDKPGERLDEEVFLYDANDNRVVCASCNPTGAKPHGIEIPNTAQNTRPLIDTESQWGTGRWLASALPVPYTIGTFNQLAVRQPRYLSNGGRLFFDSTDGLVSSDRNGATDAYEYEPSANGETVADGANDTCSTGATTYNASAEGCIDLVSSGASLDESVFLEASENGDDVFFLTSARLASSDVDSAYDVYDAHVCGSGWECPAPPVVSPPCTGTESCRGAPAPQPSIYGSPSSATFAGPGNPAPATQPTITVKKTTKKTVKCKPDYVKKKVKKKEACVKAKSKKRAKKSSAKRASNNRRASR
jgi:hypothetical protein